MGPSRRKTPLFLVAATCFLPMLTASCLGNDFRNLPLGVDKWDHGWMIAIEPEEELGVDLTGNNAHPDSQWVIAEYDRAILRLEAEEHEKPRPPSGDPNATEAAEYDPGALVPRSGFTFTGVELGSTSLRFELVAEGELIDLAEYTVEVVEDSCATDTAAVANRCGGDGFTDHPQVLHERNYGETVTVAPGATSQLVLTANALYPDQSWQVVDLDQTVLAVEGPRSLGPARTAGDYSEVEADASHSFLPAWEYTIRGVAIGESPLVLEIAADGGRVDHFLLEIVVAEE